MHPTISLNSQSFSYPAVYFFCVLPLSIVRWVDFDGNTIPAASTIVTSIIYSLTGFFNVLLFKFTRPARTSVASLDPPSQHDLPALG